MTYNLTRPRRAKAMKPKDFMPQFGRRRIQSGEEIKAVLFAFAAAQNEKVARGKHSKT